MKRNGVECLKLIFKAYSKKTNLLAPPNPKSEFRFFFGSEYSPPNIRPAAGSAGIALILGTYSSRIFNTSPSLIAEIKSFLDKGNIILLLSSVISLFFGMFVCFFRFLFFVFCVSCSNSCFFVSWLVVAGDALVVVVRVCFAFEVL